MEVAVLAELVKKLPDIVAIDPGGTTGLCWYRKAESDMPGRIELEQPEHHLALKGFLLSAWIVAKDQGVPLHIVCERFDFRRDDQTRDKIDYIANEYVGVVKLFMQEHSGLHWGENLVLVMHGAAQAVGETAFFGKSPQGIARLKKLTLWVPGQRHAMDATRHYLYHRVFELKDESLLFALK